MSNDTTVVRDAGRWIYRSADPFLDGQLVGRIKPVWARRAMIEATARDLCIAAGENPDAIGEPPSTDGTAVVDHAFPRWMSYRQQAAEIVDNG